MEDSVQPIAEQTDFKTLRRVYSWVGVCFAAVLVVSTVTQLLAVWAPIWIDGEHNALSAAPWWFWIASTVPMYAIAFPIGFAMLSHLPSVAPEKRSLSPKTVLALIPVSIFAMYAGNLVGNALSMLLSGGQAQNAVAELAMDTHPLKFVMMVIVAPVFEELLCRKALLDRTRGYGAALSAVMSGAIFGLLHQNFFQFFYAFALGLVFSWIYLHSGRILIPILFHMGVNFLGSVVAPAVMNLIDAQTLDALTNGTISPETLNPETLMALLPGLLVMIAYACFMIVMSILGLILLVDNRRRISWPPTAWDAPLKTTLKSSLLNVGMVVYTVLCVIMFVRALFVG